MPEQWYIFPLIRQFIGKLASICALLSIATVIGAIAEVLLLSVGLFSAALFCGMTSDVFLTVLLVGSSLLAQWSHNVLLADRGLFITRYFTLFNVVFALILLTCEIYTVTTHQLLLVKQGELPFFITIILITGVLLNMHRMAAAPLKWRIMLPAYPLILLAVLITQAPQTLLYCTAAKALLAATGYPLLKRLSILAPKVVTMPELR